MEENRASVSRDQGSQVVSGTQEERLLHNITTTSHSVIGSDRSKDMSVSPCTSETISRDEIVMKDSKPNTLGNTTANTNEINKKTDCATYNCTKCEVPFSSDKELLSHSCAKETNLNRFRCKMCKQVFPKSSELSNHLKEFHGSDLVSNDVKSIVESSSSKEPVSKSVSSLNRTSLSCTYCGKSFKVYREFQEHIDEHKDEEFSGGGVLSAKGSKGKELFKKPYPPIEDEPETSTKRKKYGDNGEPVEDTPTPSTSGLNSKASNSEIQRTSKKSPIHYQTYISISKKYRYTCDICTELFSCEEKFVSHFQAHTQDVPTLCKMCMKWFSNENMLLQHNSSCHGYT